MIGIIGAIIWLVGLVVLIVSIGSDKENGKTKIWGFIIGLLLIWSTSYMSGLGWPEDPAQGLLYYVEGDPIVKGSTVYITMTNVNDTVFYAAPKANVDPALKKGDWATYEYRLLKKVNQTQT